MARQVEAVELKAMLGDGGELALLDAREELAFSESHLLQARSLPLSRLELRVATLVPRRTTRIVLCDGDDGLAARAAAKLESFGYSDVGVLAGGTAGWAKTGFELFSGVNVPSKAFGEHIEHASGTPSIGPDELHAMLSDGTDLVVLDSRPFDEFHRVSIPSGIDTPGAELVFRARDLAPNPETLVVVNCAGRTRSIIGAQSLINAGLPNRVVALRNGTMGWTLAGFAPDHGKERRAPPPSAAGLAWAKEAAARVSERYGVARIDRATLARWQHEADRTTYLFDVRDPDEYAAGHLSGAVSAPGGQLVQATDHYVGTLGARLVLADPQAVRAQMTASWLKQMGWRDVAVLAETGSETGVPAPVVLGPVEQPALSIDAAALADLLVRDAATVVDLSSSRAFRDGHIPGAWFAIRARLDIALARIDPRGMLVLTSEDGVLAGLACEEAAALTPVPARYLAGGNRAWTASGRGVARGEDNMADEAIDLWLKPYDRASGVKDAMADYLAWEIDLVHRIARDGTLKFASL